MSRPGAVVLLSAGLDSSYNLARAREKMTPKLALTFDYGQRAAEREVESAADLAKFYDVRHQILDVTWFKDFSRSALNDKNASVPLGHDVSLDDLATSRETARAVWVPNRNGVLLNIAAAFAEGLGAEVVIPGFNVEEAATFPDNSEDFLRRLDESFALSTASHVRTHCFSTGLNKTEIVADGLRLGLPFARLWPCYLAGDRWCGICESCQRYRRALEANGLSFSELNAH